MQKLHLFVAKDGQQQTTQDKVLTLKVTLVYNDLEPLLYCVHLVPFWNECLVSNVPSCLCIVSEGRKDAEGAFFIALASLRSNRRRSTCEVSLRWSIVACVYKHRKQKKTAGGSLSATAGDGDTRSQR